MASELSFCVQDPLLRKDSERSHALRELELKLKHTCVRAYDVHYASRIPPPDWSYSILVLSGTRG